MRSQTADIGGINCGLWAWCGGKTTSVLLHGLTHPVGVQGCGLPFVYICIAISKCERTRQEGEQEHRGESGQGRKLGRGQECSKGGGGAAEGGGGCAACSGAE